MTSLAEELIFLAEDVSVVVLGGGGSFLNTLENLDREKYLDDEVVDADEDEDDDDDDDDFLALLLLLLRRCFT